MSKKLLQDMVKVNNNDSFLKKKTLNKNIVNNIKTNKEKFVPYEDAEILINTNSPKYLLWLVAFISIVFLFFAVSFLFSGAQITINPKIENVSLDESISATRDLNSNNIPFDLVVLSGEESKNIPSGEKKDVMTKAKGTIVFYNAFSASSQIIAINTRLEGSNGKIYKTDKKITIPGMNKINIPGKIEVGIYAIDAGDEYNSEPLDFKVLGFKGTSKYSKLYARSKGSITGGLKGTVNQVSENEKVLAVKELKNTLQEKLLKKAGDQIPSGFILFKDAVFLNTDEGTIDLLAKENEVPITVKGTLYGVLLDEKKLNTKILSILGEKYKTDEVYISNVRDLKFSLSNKETISFIDVKNISFNLLGMLKIVSDIDEVKIVSDMVGKNKKDFNEILSQYTSVDSAELVLKPLWKMSFPEKPENIKVIVNYPK